MEKPPRSSDSTDGFVRDVEPGVRGGGTPQTRNELRNTLLWTLCYNAAERAELGERVGRGRGGGVRTRVGEADKRVEGTRLGTYLWLSL